MRAFAAIFSILLIANSIIFASSVSMTGEISEAGTDRITFTINVLGNQALTYIIPGQIRNIEIRGGNGQAIEPNVQMSNGTSAIRMTIPDGHAEGAITTDFLTMKDGNIWLFNSTSTFSIPIANLESKVKLPPGSMIIQTNGVVEDEFWGPSVLWHYDNISAMEAQSRYIIYHIDDKPNYSTVLMVAAAGAVTISLWFAFNSIKIRAEKSGKTDAEHGQEAIRPNALLASLEETDKEIINEIIAQGGKTTQAHIHARTHISKAALSRHLVSLENRGLINRSQRGIRKLVSLAPILEGQNASGQVHPHRK